ncbi:MAG: alpha/beta hydrolase [Candidatus Cyclobacteriaceae bacterium M2_1C_046]
MTRKKDKTPIALKAMAWLFPKLERFVPQLASRLFVHVFFTPARYPFPEKEKVYVDQAEKEQLIFKGRKVMVYKWGEGKPVLMMHGWMGRATQFRKFIKPFNDAGYQVVAFDAPAHGKSQGIKSHLMYFVKIIEILNQKHNFHGIIGHSLGGVAGMHVIHRGADIPSLIMIGSPSIADEIIGEFLRRLGGTWKSGKYFKKYIQKTYNQPFESYTGEYLIQHIKDFPLMLIYDEDDFEVKIEHAEAIVDKYPEAKFIRTKGLGHTRILKDEEVIERSLNFINSHT